MQVKLIWPFQIIIALIFGINATCQKYNFTNFSVGEGLPQSQIYAILEDRDGYLWFGSYGGGISKFNGITFTNYNEEEGLQNNFVKCFAQDRDGNIWIGTDDGLCIFDGNTFNPFFNNSFPKSTIVKAIVADKAKNLWIGTQDNGLYKITKTNTEHFTTKNGLANNNINCLYIDKDENTWIGTENGANKIENNEIISFTSHENFPFSSVRSITQDKDGNIWFSSYGGGVGFLGPEGFTRYKTTDGLCSNIVNTIFCDSKGQLWFGTANGISCFNGKSFKTFTDREGLCGNIIVTIIEDSDKNLWFGSSGGGVSRFDNERFAQLPENNEMGKWVYAISQDKKGKFWFGTSLGGVTLLDSNKYELFRKNKGFTDEKVKAIFCDRDGELWFGTLGEGVYRFSENKFTEYSTQQGLCGNFISGITADTAGNIWFASLDRGIGFYNKKNNTFSNYRERDGLGGNRVNTVCADSFGNIWAALAGGGLSYISFKDTTRVTPIITNFNKQNGLTSNNLRSICTKKDKVFVGTSGSGICIRYSNGKIKTISKKNGLYSNNIYSLLIDHNNNLWSGTEKGIDKIVFDKDSILRIIHYGKQDGFIGVETHQNSIFEDTTGNIWFGTVNGAIRYNPNFESHNESPPRIHITSISLFFDKIENTKYAGKTDKWSHLPNELSLPYNKNHLSFEFIGIDYKNPGAIRYKWKLEGFDKDWSPEVQKREATYSNLPPGEYTFMVKTCNENGIWSLKPAEFRFTIKPPFWSIIWFQLTGFIILAGIVWFIISAQLKRIKQRNLEEKQRLELEKNVLELEQATSRLQMNPHFIFNSLNSIQGYIANNDSTQAKWYLSKFAKLMRLILDNAREEFIPLYNEVEILENYLLLEKLRANNKFEFSIHIKDDLDIQNLEIPPMLLQPFAENAILHGIKHKEGKGNIHIEFSINNNLLICKITDDGIGREKAKELKTKTSAEHQSSAIKITQERLKLLNKDNNPDVGLLFSDLKDAYGYSTGTLVTIKLPI